MSLALSEGASVSGWFDNVCWPMRAVVAKIWVLASALLLSGMFLYLLGFIAGHLLLYYYILFFLSVALSINALVSAIRKNLAQSILNFTAAGILMFALINSDRTQLRTLALPFYSSIQLIVSNDCYYKPTYLNGKESFKVCKVISNDLYDIVDLYIKFEDPHQARTVLTKLKVGAYSGTPDGEKLKHELTVGSSDFEIYEVFSGYFLVEMHIGQEPFDARLLNR